MSVVTNIILSVGALDGDFPDRGACETLEAVNQFFHPRPGLLPLRVAGGWKAFEADVFTGAFNYLDLPAFMAHLRSVEWREPDLVQVFVMEQEDELFRLLRLNDETD